MCCLFVVVKLCVNESLLSISSFIRTLQQK